MENKLQELTTKIYNEGIDKANKEAESIIENAKTESEKLLKQARKEADEILAKAQKDAGEIKKNVESEVKMSARQSVNALKQQLAELVTAKSTGDEVSKAFDDKEFLKKIIESAIKNWNPKDSKSNDLILLLPEKDRSEMDKYFASKQKSLLDAGLELKFDSDIDSGFKIGPKDDSFKISFTEEDFENFFRNYLRPRTAEMLYSTDK